MHGNSPPPLPRPGDPAGLVEPIGHHEACARQLRLGLGVVPESMEEAVRDRRASERVKSIARGLMEKLPADVLPGMGSESEKKGARARAPKRAPARRAKPKKAKG